MTIKKEVEEFKKTNGNIDYTPRDMLMFLCSKVDKIDERINGLVTNIGKNDIITSNNIKGIETIKTFGVWLVSILIPCLGGLLFLILKSHNLI